MSQQYDIKHLPSKDEIEQMSAEEVQGLLEFIKKLNHDLGNGTLEALRASKQKVKAMVELAGELDACLKG